MFSECIKLLTYFDHGQNFPVFFLAKTESPALGINIVILVPVWKHFMFLKFMINLTYKEAFNNTLYLIQVPRLNYWEFIAEIKTLILLLSQVHHE